MLTPADGEKLEPEEYLAWEAVSDRSGVRYVLQVAADELFTTGNNSSIVFQKAGIIEPKYFISEEELPGSGKPYYWRVRAVDNAFNEGEWSAVRTFYYRGEFNSWFLYSLVIEGVIFSGMIAIWVIRKRRDSARSLEPATESI